VFELKPSPAFVPFIREQRQAAHAAAGRGRHSRGPNEAARYRVWLKWRTDQRPLRKDGTRAGLERNLCSRFQRRAFTVQQFSHSTIQPLSTEFTLDLFAPIVPNRGKSATILTL
jgi:hypothetical protein